MRKPRFAEPQLMAVLCQAEGGVAVRELRHEHGISSASFYKWRVKYGGMDPSMMSSPKRCAENEIIADLLEGLTKAHRTWGFGLCLSRICAMSAGMRGTTSASAGSTANWS